MKTPQQDSIDELPENIEWEILPVNETWLAQFRQFQRSAFRLEVLQSYAEPSESAALENYLKGREVPRDYIADWCELVESHISQGHTMSRIHIVDLPLSSYMQFEIDCAYTHTCSAGENVKLLNRAELPPHFTKYTEEDFWLFDDKKVMVQIYNDNGTLQHSKLTTNDQAVRYYCSIREKLVPLSCEINSLADMR